MKDRRGRETSTFHFIFFLSEANVSFPSVLDAHYETVVNDRANYRLGVSRVIPRWTRLPSDDNRSDSRRLHSFHFFCFVFDSCQRLELKINADWFKKRQGLSQRVKCVSMQEFVLYRHRIQMRIQIHPHVLRHRDSISNIENCVAILDPVSPHFQRS